MAPAAVWSDVRTVPGRQFRGRVDGLIGGIPCQPHSLAGRRGGSTDERDLWSPARRIIAQARPWFVLIENVAGFLSAGADEIPGAARVRGDLRKLGFQSTLVLVRADQVGLPHERLRAFILGVADWFVADRQGAGAALPSNSELVDAFGGGRDGRSQGEVREPERRGPDERAGGRPFLRPPGPGDVDAWRHVALVAPGLLPAVSRYDRLRLEMGAQGFVAAGDPSSGRQSRAQARKSRRGAGQGASHWLDAASGDALGAPVVQAAVERALRGVADVLATRIDELRMLGNGVADAQGALAVRIGVRNLHASGSAGAAFLMALMGEA